MIRLILPTEGYGQPPFSRSLHVNLPSLAHSFFPSSSRPGDDREKEKTRSRARHAYETGVGGDIKVVPCARNATRGQMARNARERARQIIFQRETRREGGREERGEQRAERRCARTWGGEEDGVDGLSARGNAPALLRCRCKKSRSKGAGKAGKFRRSAGKEARPPTNRRESIHYVVSAFPPLSLIDIYPRRDSPSPAGEGRGEGLPEESLEN